MSKKKLTIEKLRKEFKKAKKDKRDLLLFDVDDQRDEVKVCIVHDREICVSDSKGLWIIAANEFHNYEIKSNETYINLGAHAMANRWKMYKEEKGINNETPVGELTDGVIAFALRESIMEAKDNIAKLKNIEKLLETIESRATKFAPHTRALCQSIRRVLKGKE